MDLSGRLPIQDFLSIVERTHLISVDFLINHQGKYLLGRRLNNPAKGTLFVPGSRIYKNERIEDGLKRAILDETGIEINDKNIQKKGVYYHNYPNNYSNDLFGTNYIVFPFEIKVSSEIASLCDFNMKKQHSDVIWMTPDEIITSNEVHQFTKNYFIENPENCFIKF